MTAHEMDFLYGEGNEHNAQAGITCASRVANCLDTLKLSLWVDFSNSNLLERLEVAKMQVQEGDADAVALDLAGHDWNIHRSGTSRYNYRLTRGDVRVLINRRKPSGAMPTLRLEIGSVSCWSPGYQSIYRDVVKMIELFGGCIIKERVSEAHLAADLIGVPLTSLPLNEQEHWITRAHSFSMQYDRRRFSGITWGKGDFMLRVYDKVLELKVSTHKQVPFAEIWGVETFDELPVTRVEFQVRRPVLREFHPAILETGVTKAHQSAVINTLADLQTHLDALWQYCTQEWCRLADGPVDRNHHQSRAKNHSFWDQVKSIAWNTVGLAVRAKVYLLKDFWRLRQQMAGIGMSVAAMFGRTPDDVDMIIAFAQGCLESDLRRSFRENQKDFMNRMRSKLNAAAGPFTLPVEALEAAV